MGRHEADRRDRKLAARVFSRIARDPEHRRLNLAERTVVCLECDEFQVVQHMIEGHYGDTARVAVYYPKQQIFRFITVGIHDDDLKPAIAGHPETTVGMVIDAIRAQQSNWALPLPDLRTSEIEARLATA